MTRIPAFFALLLAFAAVQARADLPEVDQKILEYNVTQAREALGRAGGSEADKLVAEGRILALEKKYGEAEAKLRRATEVQGDDPAVWNHLGELRERAGNGGGAREAFQRASDLARKRVESGGGGAAHYQLGRALAGLRSFDAAAEHLRQAQQGGAVLATYQLGVARATQEKWNESVDLLTQAIAANSGIAYAYYYRGLAASKIGRKDLLLNDLDRFLKLAPNAPEADRVRRMLQSAKR
jgi:tetratricopeptide (TPR) repeat protein